MVIPECYDIPNVMGTKIELYQFKGTIEDNQKREKQMDGVGLTLYFVDVEVDEDGCLFVGLTKQQAIHLAQCLSNIVFNPNISNNGSK